MLVVRDCSAPPYETDPRTSSHLATPMPATSEAAHSSISRREETRVTRSFAQSLGASLELIRHPLQIANSPPARVRIWLGRRVAAFAIRFPQPPHSNRLSNPIGIGPTMVVTVGTGEPMTTDGSFATASHQRRRSRPAAGAMAGAMLRR